MLQAMVALAILEQTAKELPHRRLEEIMRRADTPERTIAQNLKGMLDSEKFSRKDFLDHLTTLFLGRADTTSKVLCWAF